MIKTNHYNVQQHIHKVMMILFDNNEYMHWILVVFYMLHFLHKTKYAVQGYYNFNVLSNAKQN